MKIWNNQAIGVKTETTQNTAATLAATDFMLAMDVKAKAEKEKIPRDYKRSTLDTVAHITGQRYWSISFKTELKGSGSAGTAYAPLGAAIQACGFTEAVSGGVSVTYAPTSTAASANYFGPGKSCTIKFYQDGSLKVLAGCQGNMKIVGSKAGGIVVLEFEFKGIYTAQTDASFPTQTYLSQIPAIWESSTVQLLGVATAIMSSFSIETNNTVSLREDGKSAAGIKGFVITKREPKCSVVVEDELVATHDFYGKLISAAESQTSMTVGASAGNINTITMTKTQIETIEETDVDGIQKLNITLQVNQSSGDDWISLVQT